MIFFLAFVFFPELSLTIESSLDSIAAGLRKLLEHAAMLPSIRSGIPPLLAAVTWQPQYLHPLLRLSTMSSRHQSGIIFPALRPRDLNFGPPLLRALMRALTGVKTNVDETITPFGRYSSNTTGNVTKEWMLLSKGDRRAKLMFETEGWVHRESIFVSDKELSDHDDASSDGSTTDDDLIEEHAPNGYEDKFRRISHSPNARQLALLAEKHASTNKLSAGEQAKLADEKVFLRKQKDLAFKRQRSQYKESKKAEERLHAKRKSQWNTFGSLPKVRHIPIIQSQTAVRAAPGHVKRKYNEDLGREALAFDEETYFGKSYRRRIGRKLRTEGKVDVSGRPLAGLRVWDGSWSDRWSWSGGGSGNISQNISGDGRANVAYRYDASGDGHGEVEVEVRANPYDHLGNMYTFTANKNFGVEMDHDHPGDTEECQRPDGEEVDGEVCRPDNLKQEQPGEQQEVTTASASIPTTPASAPRVSMPGSFDVEDHEEPAEAATGASGLFSSSTWSNRSQTTQKQQSGPGAAQISPRTVSKPQLTPLTSPTSPPPSVDTVKQDDSSPTEAPTGATGFFSRPSKPQAKSTRQARVHQRPPAEMLAAPAHDPVLVTSAELVPVAGRTFAVPMTDTDTDISIETKIEMIKTATATVKYDAEAKMRESDEDLQDKIDKLSEASDLSDPPASDEEL